MILVLFFSCSHSPEDTTPAVPAISVLPVFFQHCERVVPGDLCFSTEQTGGELVHAVVVGDTYAAYAVLGHPE